MTGLKNNIVYLKSAGTRIFFAFLFFTITNPAAVFASTSTTITAVAKKGQQGNCGNGMGGLEAWHKGKSIDIFFCLNSRHCGPTLDYDTSGVCGFGGEATPISGKNIIAKGKWGKSSKDDKSLCNGNSTQGKPCFHAQEIRVLKK